MKKTYIQPAMEIMKVESHLMESSLTESKIPVEKDDFADDSPILSPGFDTSMEW